MTAPFLRARSVAVGLGHGYVHGPNDHVTTLGPGEWWWFLRATKTGVVETLMHGTIELLLAAG